MSESMPKPGDRVGNYRIVRQIGKGGMGAVFEAIDDATGERAAIKVLHARFSGDPEALARFLNEGRAIEALDHPGIVKPILTGELPGGAFFIAMEYLDGETLGARIKRQGRMGPMALYIGAQMAAALSVAHRRNIIHRDLKPSNIILVKDPEGEKTLVKKIVNLATEKIPAVKIIDFGIAKLSAEDQGEQDFRTRTGTRLGTPVYMAPEQCRGVEVSDRTDVYALGVILYQMLCGRPPFTSPADGDVLAMHILVPPPPLRDFEPNVPAKVAAFVEQLLEKNATDRPSMPEVELRLRELAADPSWKLVEQPPAAAAAEPADADRTRSSIDAPTAVTPHGRDMPSPTTIVPPTAMGQAETRMRTRRMNLAVAGSVIVLSILGAVALRSVRPPASPSLAPPDLSTPAVTVTAPVAPPSKPAAPRTVRWKLRSEPPGALILDAAGNPLGHTPWEYSAPAGVGTQSVSLRLAGYQEQRLELARGQDVTHEVKLAAEPAPVRKNIKVPKRSGPGAQSGSDHGTTLFDFKTRRQLGSSGGGGGAQRPSR